MMRRELSTFVALVSLALIGACGRSEEPSKPEPRAGAGGSAANAGSSSGSSSAPGGAAGSQAGGTAGTSSGGADAGGDGGTAAGGLASAGAPASGGDSGEGGEGSPSGSAARPGWVPGGPYGPEADDLVNAVLEYLTRLCQAGLCASGVEPTEEAIERCVVAESYNFAPSLQWLACASKESSEAVRELGEYFADCAARIRPTACGLSFCPPYEPSSTASGCPERSPYAVGCAGDDTSTALPCDGTPDCADGYDERNCDPAATSYRCADDETVPWSAVCNGELDCSDGADEHGCEP